VIRYLSLKGRHPPINDLEGDFNVESDCDEDFRGTKDETSKAKEEKEEQTRAVFSTGSFSAYVDFLALSPPREK